jgi:hypothetical protein
MQSCYNRWPLKSIKPGFSLLPELQVCLLLFLFLSSFFFPAIIYIIQIILASLCKPQTLWHTIPSSNIRLSLLWHHRPNLSIPDIPSSLSLSLYVCICVSVCVCLCLCVSTSLVASWWGQVFCEALISSEVVSSVSLSKCLSGSVLARLGLFRSSYFFRSCASLCFCVSGCVLARPGLFRSSEFFRSCVSLWLRPGGARLLRSSSFFRG